MQLEQLDIKLPPLLKVVANVSTAHLTSEDANLLEGATNPRAYSFIGRYECGYFLETWPAGCNEEARESRYSDPL